MPEASRHRSHGHSHGHKHGHKHGHGKRDEDPKGAEIVWEWYWACCHCTIVGALSTTLNLTCPGCDHLRCEYCPMEAVKTIVCYWYLLKNDFPQARILSWLTATKGRTRCKTLILIWCWRQCLEEVAVISIAFQFESGFASSF